MSDHAVVRAAVGLFALVVACVPVARAGEVVSNDVFTSGVSFENYDVGAFTASLSDTPADPYSRDFYWYAPTKGADQGQIQEYGAVAPYDYAASGYARNPYLTNAEPSVSHYLALEPETNGLSRSIFERVTATYDFSNVVVRTATRDSIYCDMLVKFTPDDDVPYYGRSSRIVVWARTAEGTGGTVATNLMVTAGQFTNRLAGVRTRDLRLDISEACPSGLDCDRWYRLTIRAHGDVSPQGTGLSCFSLYLDGRPLRGVEGEYALCADGDDIRSDWLTPEARALAADRRLFPGMVMPRSDEAYAISGLTFVGEGLLDDLTFSSEDPGYAKAETVFTLKWDAGVTALRYTLDGGRTTQTAPVATARSADILLGSAATNGLVLKVVQCVYDTEGGYAAGVWVGSDGATLRNGSEFVFDGTTRNPVAVVASTRNSVRVGTGGFDTFDSAFAALDASAEATKTLELASDMDPIPVSNQADAYGNYSRGYVQALNPDGEYVLDLKGHTLRGQGGRKPTLVIGCKSFRIVDSGDDEGRKTGCVLPAQHYTNANEILNTSVRVYPQLVRDRAVEPVVTIEAGRYDGWVRNAASVYGDTAVSGALFVDGGRYFSTNAQTFYLDSCVTNPSALFAYADGYWSRTADTNLVIWTGAGEDGPYWQDPDNWRGQTVPTADRVAYFPLRESGEPPWTVDVGENGISTTNLWLEGDVALSGTNDFARVALRGAGRICGDAQLVFDGVLPGRLTETTLHADWAGTVLVRNVGQDAPATLAKPETWGTARSTVVFNGVRGSVEDADAHTMPYALVLRDRVFAEGGATVTNAAWRSDAGLSSSTLAFTGALSGDGTFQTGADGADPILQLFKFADVRDFRGRFDVSGKRVLIGGGTDVAAQPGLLAFGDAATVRAGLGWRCQRASFGRTLHVWGETNDVLVACAQEEPDVTVCTNLTLNGYSGLAWLVCTNEPKWTVFVSGTRPPWASVPSAAGSFLASDVFAAAAEVVPDAADYSAAALRATAFALAPVAVENADVSLSVGDETVLVTVSNAATGLWYGIRHRASLDDPWEAPDYWEQAEGPVVRLECEKTADEGFYGVVVTVEDPYSEGAGR